MKHQFVNISSPAPRAAATIRAARLCRVVRFAGGNRGRYSASTSRLTASTRYRQYKSGLCRVIAVMKNAEGRLLLCQLALAGALVALVGDAGASADEPGGPSSKTSPPASPIVQLVRDPQVQA